MWRVHFPKMRDSLNLVRSPGCENASFQVQSAPPLLVWSPHSKSLHSVVRRPSDGRSFCWAACLPACRPKVLSDCKKLTATVARRRPTAAAITNQENVSARYMGSLIEIMHQVKDGKGCMTRPGGKVTTFLRRCTALYIFSANTLKNARSLSPMTPESPSDDGATLTRSSFVAARAKFLRLQSESHSE